MDIMIIVVTAAVLMVLAIAAAVLYYTAADQKKQRNQYQNQSKSVLVKNGVDVKKQVLGGEKGEYFTGNLENQGTYYVNPSVTVWRVVFDNADTNERHYIDFVRQMWIGRTAAKQNKPVKLVLNGDEKISRDHCTIYESNGILCIRDLNSSNHTYLNGAVVAKETYLQSGDMIRIGDTQLRVRYSIMKDGSRSNVSGREQERLCRPFSDLREGEAGEYKR